MALSAQNPTARMKGPTCMVECFLVAAPPDDAATLTAWIGDETRPIAGIHRALKDEYGTTPPATIPGTSSLQRHRRGECACGTR